MLLDKDFDLEWIELSDSDGMEEGGGFDRILAEHVGFSHAYRAGFIDGFDGRLPANGETEDAMEEMCRSCVVAPVGGDAFRAGPGAGD